MKQTILSVAQIKDRLASANLSKLSRDTGVDLRTLRRIKNGQKEDIMASTAELLSSHLHQPKTRGKQK